MNCPKCNHETHEVKSLGCHKCEVCGWHGDPKTAVPAGTNTVTLSLADYLAFKTACEDAKKGLEGYLYLSHDETFCCNCKSGKGPECRECSTTIAERTAISALRSIEAVIGE